jgi:hypothetical protein
MNDLSMASSTRSMDRLASQRRPALRRGSHALGGADAKRSKVPQEHAPKRQVQPYGLNSTKAPAQRQSDVLRPGSPNFAPLGKRMR